MTETGMLLTDSLFCGSMVVWVLAIGESYQVAVTGQSETSTKNLWASTLDSQKADLDNNFPNNKGMHRLNVSCLSSTEPSGSSGLQRTYR